MKIEITSSSKTFAIETDCGKEITVLENYDANSDSYQHSMYDTNTDEELDSDNPLFNEILEKLNNY